VAVVGAGPAGSSAALALSRNGFDVLLLEKASLPRYKTCGGGVLNRAYKLLPPRVEEVVERKFFSVDLNFLAAGLNFTASRAVPLVYMTMRADLDYLLVNEAKAAGAQVIDSCPVRSATIRGQAVEISAEKATFQAKFVIAADGVHSVIAKAAGWSDLPHLAPAIEHEIYLSEEDFECFGKTARFDFDCVETGYGWVFPKRNHLSAGILSARRANINLHEKLAEYLKRIGIDRIQKVERHGYLIPIAPRREKLARDRVLLVGDAAGLVDPIMAEGISYSVLSGQLAAQAIAECGFDVQKAGNRYQSLLEEKILGDLRAARRLGYFLYNCPKLRNWVFRHRGEELANYVADVVMGNRGYSDALKSPFSYLKLLAGSRTNRRAT
jgi:geranylgeranyl reductase family protein